MKILPLVENLQNKTLYHLSDVELIGGKPWVNQQGAHFAENIDTCNYLQGVRNYDDPHFYKFNIIKELHPLYIKSDAIYWDAKNLSRKLINKRYVNIDFTDGEKSRLKYFISLPNGKSTKENELEIYQMLLNRGYNCVAYKNTQEPGTGHSILLFDTSFISKGILVDENGDEIKLKESYYPQVITDGVNELPIEKELDDFLNDYPYLFVKISTYGDNRYQLEFFYKTIDGKELIIWESHFLDKDYLPISIKSVIDKNYKNDLSIKRDLEKRNSELNEVYPNKGESKKDFITRFMSVTKDEYPDVKQRYAVANSYWDRKDKEK